MRQKTHPHECTQCRRLHRRPLGLLCRICEETEEAILLDILSGSFPFVDQLQEA